MPPAPPFGYANGMDGEWEEGLMEGRREGDGCGRSIGTGGREGRWEKGMEGPGTEGEGRRMGGMD